MRWALLYKGGLRGGLLWAVGVAVSLGVVVLPRLAEACTGLPAASLLRPSSGEEHPANAQLLFESSLVVIEEVYTVTVDGEPARLIIDDSFTENEYVALVLASIDPPPQPGQRVVVNECDAFDPPDELSCPPGSSFTPVWEFTAGPPDTTAPPSAGAAMLSHETGNIEYGCAGSPVELRFDLALTDLDQSGERDVLYQVDLHDSNGEIARTAHVHVDGSTPELDISFGLSEEPDNAQEYCATVSARDLSGNETFIAEACEGCACVSGPSNRAPWWLAIVPLAWSRRRLRFVRSA